MSPAMGHSQAATTLNSYACEFEKKVAESGEAVAVLLTSRYRMGTRTSSGKKPGDLENKGLRAFGIGADDGT